MKNITTNNLNLNNLDKKNIVENIKENKVALSLREFNNTKLLFRLVNTKRNNTKSYDIYEKSRLSTSIKEAFNLASEAISATNIIRGKKLARLEIFFSTNWPVFMS